MRYFLILCFFYYTTCFEPDRCKVYITEAHYERRCSNYYSCQDYLIHPCTNVTCRNLDQMHATPNPCIYDCTIKFTGKNGILRTNSFSQLTKLEQVFLNDTLISTIQIRAFSGCLLIKIIHLERNQIKKIPKNTFSQLKNLTFLNLSYNNIDEIDPESFNGCDSLNNIDLSNNNLENLSTTIMESMVQLEIVNLSSNPLIVMDPNWCFHFHSLKILIFDHNRISSLANCTLSFNMEYFSINHNYLTVLNGSSFPLNLKELYLNRNRISVLRNKPFKHLSKLEKLDISNNRLEYLPFELFVDLKNLTHLDISSNNFMTLQEGVFQGLFRIEFLNLSSISAPNLEPRVLYATKTIRSLDISRNNIQYFDIKSLLKVCPNLRYLTMNGNSFTCQALAEILLQAEENEMQISTGSTYRNRNLNGIECFEDQPESLSAKNPNQVMDYFERGFKKSAFFKFFSSFKEPTKNDLQKLTEIEESLIKNISMEIAQSENKFLKDFLVQEKDRSNMDSTNKILQRLLTYLESNKLPQDKNFTSDIFTILDHQNRAALTAENFDMKNLMSPLNEMKFMFFICTFILISFCAVKLFKQFRTHFPIETFKKESQELPIIEQRNFQI